FPAGSFAANCFVIAPDPGEDCLIIDPGEDAAPGIEEIVAKHRLRPVAALATHGHIDHIWSIAPVCDNAGIPAYIHPADRALLTGDLLFAGSIGRTDLPGGDYQTILDSLARVCLPLPDATVVLAGHGPLTTIGAERASNPFLAGLAPKAGPVRGL